MTNGISHPYHLEESIFIFRGIRSKISFLFHFSMRFLSANRIAPDGTPRFTASHLGLFCLPMSHKKDTRLIWVKLLYTTDSKAKAVAQLRISIEYEPRREKTKVLVSEMVRHKAGCTATEDG